MHPILQVLFGAVVVLVVYVIACLLIGSNGLVLSPKDELLDRRSDVTVLRGYGSLLSVADKSWSTSNQFARNYVPLLRSLNQRGGIEFTYAFWIRIDADEGANLDRIANQAILVRGDRRRFRWQMRKSSPNTSKSFGPDVLIACPAISFGNKYNEFKVSYNTLQEPQAGFVIEARPGDEPIGVRQNAMKLMLNDWALLTFVFKDHSPSNEFDDGIEVSVYLNDSLYYLHRAKGAFKVNQGDLHVAPSATGDPTSALNHVQIGDLRYSNYAMKPSDISQVYKHGPPKSSFKKSRHETAADPLYLTEYNKLDIYNT